MSKKKIDFENIFSIISNKKFLRMEGLGNEVPFFIQTYDITVQDTVYEEIRNLTKRLRTAGISVLSIGIYDIAIDYLKEKGKLEKLFQVEPKTDKDKLIHELGNKLLNSEKVIVPRIVELRRQEEPQVVLLSQVGEVFPYIRSHTLLNKLQNSCSDIPLVLFYPGEYITSYQEGFYLSLFGNPNFKGDYYRAFKLEDYKIRGRIETI
jgi:hypothetical protein